MKNNDLAEWFADFRERVITAGGLITGRYVVTEATADTPDGRQLAADGGRPTEAAHSARTIGRPAVAEPLGRVEVDGVAWVNLGQGEPLTARKCADPTCSVCGHLPGPVGAMWVALLGPLASLADGAPTGPETAAEGPWPGFMASLLAQPVTLDVGGAVRLGGRLLGVCDCPRCERGRAQVSESPDTPGGGSMAG